MTTNDPAEVPSPQFLDDEAGELIDPTKVLCVLREHVPLDFGIDFEIALSALQSEAGSRFRDYSNASRKGDETPEVIDGLRKAYFDAADRAKALRPDDDEAIKAILDAKAVASRRETV